MATPSVTDAGILKVCIEGAPTKQNKKSEVANECMLGHCRLFVKRKNIASVNGFALKANFERH